ncbi:transketolase family protein [Acanthopleuribacter pedis]|uniref:Transketolase-like pyrimidine-binding domain-containing protein n=1 Tax=Acanthopleuribacter pedis TaxID=442870 RepID=A0A8J7QGA3_9BACT|nr:transketolase C-terminal domain-containing protein [Acanthopleuribacter pedis]MBO1317995.1 hypothetical protein [Acanthopleuribacter pedis]
MRKRGLQTVTDLARQFEDVVYIGSDVGQGTMDDFREACPDRFFVEGISEQYVIGMAAGLAMNGFIPYVNTIATFLTRRCYEQIAVDMCMNNHPVRLYANGGGTVYAPLGPTHMAVDDIALMRALPNMTVIAPCDADEMERAIRASHDWKGPIYFRVARGGDAIVSKPEHDFAIGRALVFAEPEDLLLITTGVTLQVALGVAERLADLAIGVGIVHVPTIKPLDRDTLVPRLREARFVMTLEEHSTIGGLGSAIAALMAAGERHPRGVLRQLGIPDTFPDRFGRQENQFEYFGLDLDSVIRSALGFLKLDVAESVNGSGKKTR